MTNNNLELMSWDDGTIRLTFWDSLHGEDKIFFLNEDDQAYIEHEKGFKVSINLVAELRELCKKIEGRQA